jgi:hypothetical protein
MWLWILTDTTAIPESDSANLQLTCRTRFEDAEKAIIQPTEVDFQVVGDLSDDSSCFKFLVPAELALQFLRCWTVRILAAAPCPVVSQELHLGQF